MPADEFYEDLSRWIDGELPPERRAQVTAHLQSCATCREALRDFTQLSGVLRDIAASDPPACVTDNAMRLVRMRAREAGKSRWPHIPSALFDFSWLKVGLCASAVLAAVVVAIVISRRYPISSSVQVANVESAVPATSQPGSMQPTSGAPEQAPFVQKAEGTDERSPSSAATYSPPQGAENPIAAFRKAESAGAVSVRPGLRRLDSTAAGHQDCQQGYAAYEEQNYAEAKDFYELGAGMGNAECMYWLGQLYAEGAGVKSDYILAQNWYEKSADKGYAPALYDIGLLYLKGGPGMKQDDATACKWIRLAAARGVSSARDWLTANRSCD
jgi:hypothetical protein